MLDKMMRRVMRLSEAELRSLSKFLFMRYCLNAVWMVLAARRDTNGPPYFLSSISTYRPVAGERLDCGDAPEGAAGRRGCFTFLSWRSVESS